MTNRWIHCFYAFFMAVLFAACSDGAGGEGYTIEGRIEGAPEGQQVFLERWAPYYVKVNAKVIDTARIAADGTFRMQGMVERPAIYLLRAGQTRPRYYPGVYPPMQMQEQARFAPLYVDNATLTFETQWSNFAQYQVNGLSEAVQMAQVEANLQRTYQRMQEMQRRFRSAQQQGNQDMNALRQKLDQELQQLIVAHKKNITSFIDTSSVPWLRLYAAANLNPQDDMLYMKKIAAEVDQQVPNHPVVKGFLAKVTKMGRFASGEPAPQIALPDPSGDTIPLTSLRGNVVLIDFWAAWCKPCRIANPKLVKLYHKYKDQGFTIYSVSLDKHKSKWVQAIEDDNLSWDNHVSDLKGWQSAAAKLYNVSGIPATYLIDREGKFIARNLRGKELEQQLEAIFDS